ncbi:MAG: DUF1501 domain-containing protein, partial [Planctomycetota bacterium]|nr:DUF1501 domain-containing protein [Planctomycetota bacterium]
MSLRRFLNPEHSRREFLKVSLGGSMGVCLTSSLPVDLCAEETSDKAMILLWMQGGPSQTDTFDPKPGHKNAGDFKAIRTTVNGIQICEHLPQVARQMKHIGLIRSVTSTEGSHERGRYMLHTGYRPLGSAMHPSFGSIVSSEISSKSGSMPNFVSVNLPSIGPGFLGMIHSAFHVPKPEEGIPNATTAAGVNDARFNRRLKMLKSLETSFIRSGRGREAADHLEVYQKGVRLMRSSSLKAFDLSRERDGVRDAYGRNAFGDGCLLARRLVQAGVKCVEVTLNGWDTHLRNFGKNRELMGILDPAMSSLIRELS